MSLNMWKLCHKLRNAKNRMTSDLYGKMNLNLVEVSCKTCGDNPAANTITARQTENIVFFFRMLTSSAGYFAGSSSQQFLKFPIDKCVSDPISKVISI